MSDARILVVCTGNICRSPYIERVLATQLAGRGYTVESAGTRALVDYPMEPQAWPSWSGSASTTAASVHGS
ncbi:hypothetical protein [Calidifontibacter indicus]|uniref:arsenate reductase/protein-tyrosine-phosphatase family protein n=1 Tax=Calidifontibacter indicus TaxID=419650 RepID=UPI0014737FBA|nr:hypothetical protein [Calidifontibacter indicus]